MVHDSVNINHVTATPFLRNDHTYVLQSRQYFQLGNLLIEIQLDCCPHVHNATGAISKQPVEEGK